MFVTLRGFVQKELIACYLLFFIYTELYSLNKNDIFTEWYFYTVKIFTGVK